jgi:hypothetical protein
LVAARVFFLGVCGGRALRVLGGRACFFSWCVRRAGVAGAWWPRVFFFLVCAAGGRCGCLVAARVFFLGVCGGRRLRFLLRRVVVRPVRLAVRRLRFGGGSNACNKLLVGETPFGLEGKRL